MRSVSHVHDLHRVTATFMLTRGVPLRVAMEVLGHSQIHVTANTHTHIMPELKRDAANRVGTCFSAPGDHHCSQLLPQFLPNGPERPPLRQVLVRAGVAKWQTQRT